MDRVKKTLEPHEIETLGRAMDVYRGKLEEKLAELDQVQTHLKVNEGLMHEVRLEKERLRKELTACQAIFLKISKLSRE